ncbi:type VII secretion protein EssA [Streptococcus panodentis]|uniref:Type VII secretion protein EssA n=1 Tax=Streptococcus panodentis TaxID=1581472 RepID=A0ABS5AZY9_9STRE|nr:MULTISPECIES: type VII secretion protein EssA [Streptococcus]MBP2622154.1 type VII secretion protein EssA [Streptococcus panodentis]
MKKVLSLFLVLSAFAAPAAAADDLRDNSLQIDNSRIEKEQEMNFGAQSEGTKSLFIAENQEKIQEMKQYQNKQLATEAGQLFSAIQGKTDIYHGKELFQPGTEKLSKLQSNLNNQDEGSSWNDFLPGVFYFAAAMLLVGLTAFLSFRISKGDR